MDMTDTIKSLAELSDWERAHDSGIPPRLELPVPPPLTPREGLQHGAWFWEDQARIARHEAIRVLALHNDRREAERQIAIAEGYEARAIVYREALAKLEADEAQAEEIAEEEAEQEEQDNSQFGVGA
jgi:hypothetical protein